MIDDPMDAPPVVPIRPGEQVAVAVVAGASATGRGGPVMLEDQAHGMRLIIDAK